MISLPLLSRINLESAFPRPNEMTLSSFLVKRAGLRFSWLETQTKMRSFNLQKQNRGNTMKLVTWNKVSDMILGQAFWR